MNNNLFIKQLTLVLLLISALFFEGKSQENCDCKPHIEINFDNCL